MTANEIIYAIREKLKAYTDDSRYTNSYLMFLVNLKRGLYIRREYNQLQRTIDNEVLQQICMNIQEVNNTECPECDEFTSDECTLLRTDKPLPKTVELHNRNKINRIGPVGTFDIPFSIVSRNRLIYSGEGKYESRIVFATVHSNGYIYLKSKSSSVNGIERISVTALFENPDDVSLFDCTDNNCYDPEKDDYPVKSWMVDVIISDIVNELAQLKQIPADELNNAKDDN